MRALEAFERPAARNRAPYRVELLGSLGDVEQLTPVGRHRPGPLYERRPFLPTRQCRAAPGPLTRAGDKAGPCGVRLNVTQRCEEMSVIDDWHAPKPPLVHGSGDRWRVSPAPTQSVP